MGNPERYTQNQTPPASVERVHGDIVGAHGKLTKGIFYLDGLQTNIGPNGFRFTMLCDTAVHGRVLWVDNRKEDEVLYRYADQDPRFEDLPERWSAYTGFQGVTDSGELFTFTSAFGARKTIKNILTQYHFRQRRRYPVCTIDTKLRPKDPNGTIDPVFRICSWVSVNDFRELLGLEPETPALTYDKPSEPRLQSFLRDAPPALEEPPPNWEDDYGGGGVGGEVDDEEPIPL